jgi:iron complex outermembrane receptor protein
MRKLILLLTILLTFQSAVADAQGKNGDPSYSLEPVEVTATKTDLDKRLIPFSVYSVTNEEYKTKPTGYYSSVGEMVQDLPGVHVGEFFPWGMAWIQLRGTGDGINRTVHLVDGLPAYVYQGSTINSHDIARADVLLGPSSALYGNNASGGVVNMITRSGYEGMGFNVELAYGSKNTFRPHIHFGDAVSVSNGTFRYYVSYSGDFSDGYMMQPFNEMKRTVESGGPWGQVQTSAIEDNNYRFHYFASRFDWENEEDSSISFAINYTTRYLHGGQPNFTALDNTDQLVTSVRAETRISDWGKLKLSIGYQSFEAFINNTTGFVAPSYILNPTPSTRAVAHGTGNRKHLPIDLQLNIKPVENDTITVGFFYSKGTVNPADTVNINKSSQNYGQLTRYFKWDETQYGIYLQNALTLLDDRFSFIIGLRYDKWKYDNIENFLSPARGWSNPPSATFDNLAFRSGAKYWVNENLGLHLAYGTAYYQNPQNLFTAGTLANGSYREQNHDLKPEKTWMAEFGLDFIKPEWGTEAYLTFYNGEIKDVQSPHDLGNNRSIYVNNGLVKIRGIECSLNQYIIPDILRLSASVTLNHSRIVEDEIASYVGNHLKNSPDYVGSFNLLFTKPDLFNFSVSYRHTNDRYYDNANNEYVHYHMGNVDVLDARIWRDWELSDNITMTTQISGTNLTDSSYEALYTYLAPGRYIEGKVSFTYHY